MRRGERPARTLTSAMKADRATLARRLGPQAVLDVDATTGTPRVLGRLDGALTAPSSGDPAAIADAYVRSHLSALGLTAADLDSLGPAETATTPSGITQVRRRQSLDGIPGSGEVRVNVAPDGRVINVLGSPAHDLSVSSAKPSLDAGEAVRTIQDAVGAYRALPRSKGPTGATQSTTFSDGTRASLELFQRAAGARLAWHVTYKAAPDAVYDAVVDARTGDVLQRVNIVKSDSSGLVWDRYPGPAGVFGTQRRVDLSTWLDASGTLSGPNAHAYPDVDDSDTAAGEEVAPGQYPFQPVSTSSLGCDPLHLCSWSATSGSWQANREQNAVQAFYYVNRFHDHLAAAPIGFTPAWGSFEGDDKLEVNTDDGASLLDADHLDNANMATPSDGESPLMQMYLFEAGSGLRQVNGGDDAAIVYHEYTHGLSNRLVTDANGSGTLNSAQAGAMGEGWSDWYAMDYLVDQGLVSDTAAPGQVDVGEYTDATAGALRTQPADCPVGYTSPPCRGGYTYADFGKVDGRPEVHADGEIWLETLWDLRTAVGSAVAEQLITDGMRLSPPEPSFLDERNAILQADVAANDGANRDELWDVFRARGMGYFAGAVDGNDTAPTTDSSPPPAPDAPRGTIAGSVTSAETGRPLSGVVVGVAGLTSGPEALAATTGSDGRYTITGVPEASYPRLVFVRDGYDTVSRAAGVLGGQTTARDAVLRRNWASAGGNATVSTNHPEYESYGCGPEKAIDQSLATGWSSENPTGAASDISNRADPVELVIELPQAVNVAAFGMDPMYTCGDDPADSTRRATIEASASAECTGMVLAADRTFTSDMWGRLNEFAPTAGATGARCVRVRLLSSFSGSAANFRDLSEIAVYSSPPPAQPVAVDPTPTPTPTPGATPTVTPGATPTVTPGATPTAVATPSPSPPAPPSGGGGGGTPLVARPAFALPSSGKKGAAAFKVRCGAACKVTASLAADAKTARRLGLKTLGSRTVSLSGARTVTVTLSPKARRALRRHKLKSVTVTLSVAARYGSGVAVSSKRRVKLEL